MTVWRIFFWLNGKRLPLNQKKLHYLDKVWYDDCEMHHIGVLIWEGITSIQNTSFDRDAERMLNKPLREGVVMNGIVRLTGGVNKVNTANPQECLDEMLYMLSELPPDFDIAVFPALSLCSPSCGRLFLTSGLIRQCTAALEQLVAASTEHSGYIIAGVPVEEAGRVFSAMAVIHRGQLVALVPVQDAPVPLQKKSSCTQQLVPPETVFECGGLRFCVVGCDMSMVGLRGMKAATVGCDLIIMPSYSPVYAGMMDGVLDSAKELSKSVGCAVMVVNGGVGDTSFPHVYKGFAAIFECGELLAVSSSSKDSITVTADVDMEIIRSQKKINGSGAPSYSMDSAAKSDLCRPVGQNPFLPSMNAESYLDELFELQVVSLASRLENIGATKLVIGVSGGIDSTAALLVAAAVCDRLELPRGNVLGLVLPGFGTSDRTYYNALALLEKLGVSRRDISIRGAVQQHLEDIGHTGQKDITYENAQARERTQILLDVANSVGGIVVGTGDLSEEALGFSTFGGDQLANYNVNVCITKTVLRGLLGHIAEIDTFDVGEIIREILDTPVSPELLPPGESGEIQQKTEDILGPYILHDFFLYYFVKYSLSPEKIFFYACAAFGGEMKREFILDKLRMFFRRFCAGQFKRSCAPDGASITEVNLNAVNYYIPSDLDPSVLLREIDEIEGAKVE